MWRVNGKNWYILHRKLPRINIPYTLQKSHDDVIKWKLFRLTGPLCGEFTGHRWIPLTKARDAELWCFFICTWINGSVNNREAGDLRRHRAHNDVTVMHCNDCGKRYPVLTSPYRKSRLASLLTVRHTRQSLVWRWPIARYDQLPIIFQSYTCSSNWMIIFVIWPRGFHT